jgi:hypothetical protein
MPRLPFNAAPANGFPQVDDLRVGRSSTPLLGYATSDSNACRNHRGSPYALPSHDCNGTLRVLSQRSHSGEGDFGGQPPPPNTVPSGENNLDDPNTGEKVCRENVTYEGKV